MTQKKIEETEKGRDVEEKGTEKVLDKEEN